MILYIPVQRAIKFYILELKLDVSDVVLILAKQMSTLPHLYSINILFQRQEDKCQGTFFLPL